MSDLASRITKPEDKVEDKPAEAPAAAPSEETPGQAEGAGETGLQEPEWDVEVSLSDLQNNEATPFHSATSWQDLGL